MMFWLHSRLLYADLGGVGAMSPPTYDPTWCDIQPVPTNEEAIVYARNAFSLRCIGCWLRVCACVIWKFYFILS